MGFGAAFVPPPQVELAPAEIALFTGIPLASRRALPLPWAPPLRALVLAAFVALLAAPPASATEPETERTLPAAGASDAAPAPSPQPSPQSPAQPEQPSPPPEPPSPRPEQPSPQQEQPSEQPPIKQPDELLVPPVPPPAVPVPEPSPPRPEAVFSGRPPKDEAAPPGEESSWFDAGHAALGRIFFAPAIRMDRFFSDETDLDPVRAESFARLRTAVRLREDGQPNYAVGLFADIKLPGMSRWLRRTRFVITGESEPLDPNSVEGAASPTFTPRERGTANFELRYGAYRGVRSAVDTGAGVDFRLPIAAYTRVRYRLAVPIEDRLLGRFSSQVFWRTDTHLGSRLTAGLEWPATASSLVRMGGAAEVAQRHRSGVEYAGELVYSYAFTPRSAVALGTDAQGNTKIPVVLEKYRLYTRFRQDVLRRWLFVEIEPEVGWPWNVSRGRYQAYAVTLRVEIQFEGDRAVEASR